jgi:hypothetical protein
MEEKMFGYKKRQIGRQIFDKFQQRMSLSDELLWLNNAESLKRLREENSSIENFDTLLKVGVNLSSTALVIMRLKVDDDKSVVRSVPFFYQLWIDDIKFKWTDNLDGVSKLIETFADESADDEDLIKQLGSMILEEVVGLDYNIEQDFALEIGKHVFENVKETIYCLN